MAKLNAYYTLCPLIDQQNLLGVEQDKESGCAIVTLGRNMVIRYKLQELKQISSWSSKEKLTSQVIYDKLSQRYAAIFKRKKIRIWSEEEVDLNDVKGYKFQPLLHTILTHGDLPPVLVQQNGATASLKWAIENSKVWTSKGILKNKEELLHCQLIYLNKSLSLYCLTKVEDAYNCLIVKLTNDTCLEEANTVKRIKLQRESRDLTGHTVIQNKNNAYQLTLWSDGRLYSHLLTGRSDGPGDDGTLIALVTNINPKHPVVMIYLNEMTIAVYGADVTDEGAVLMIYNVQYKLAQAVQKLKLYTSNAKLWKVKDKLFLAANRHLAIAPYHLAPQRIAAMLGSSLGFKDVDTDVIVVQEATVAKWEENDRNQARAKSSSLERLPARFSKLISTRVAEGWSDIAILQSTLPDLIASGDVASICWFLDTFKDLSEKLLVDLLVFALRCPEVFVPLQNGTTADGDVLPVGRFTRNAFLDKVFSVNYCGASLLPHLKASLTFDEVIRLLEYLTDKLNEQADSLDEDDAQPSEKQLYEWSGILLDSYHQQYLLSQDEHVLELFNRLSAVVEKHIQFLQDLESLRPILERTMNGKPLRPSSRKYNKYYSIEEIKFH